MNKTVLAFAATLLASSGHADTLVTNANGVEVDSAAQVQHFTGLLIGDDGKIVRVLRRGEATPKTAATVDVQGRTLMPGFIDAHGHVIELGEHALQLDLVGTSSLADLKRRLGEYAAAHPGSKWIVGAGWNQELWPDKRFPTAADLDSVVSDRPVVLARVDGHALVANSAAMKAAGVTAQTAAPAGGRIENGLFVDNAKELIEKAIPAPSSAELDAAFGKAQDILLSFGVTGVGSMSTALADWEAMKRAGEAKRLDVRFMVYADELNLLKEVPQPTAWLYGDRLRMVGIKFYADGALGSRGAWLKRPYADMPGSRGLQFHSDAELRSLYDTAASHGFQIATHAIGDAANAQVISGYEQLNAKYGTNRRWRIEHAQIVDCADLPRIGAAHVIASMQPTHQTSDRLMAEERLDPARLKCAYAWQSMMKTGAKLAFGTDFPVESPNPFPGLSAAISRQDVNGQPPGGWYPAERVSLGEALNAYTRGAAYAGFAEDRIGALEPGKWADFVIVDRDPTKVNPQELAHTKVLETWIAGRKVWSSAPSASAAPERGK
ncbi:MAG TPA: amidohydrolase [Sphingomicrobium sp.]|nr:amidohydrolase [Sphingomicrobium sp.]